MGVEGSQSLPHSQIGIFYSPFNLEAAALGKPLIQAEEI